jgi:N-acetylneuraminic acid mutarotase
LLSDIFATFFSTNSIEKIFKLLNRPKRKTSKSSELMKMRKGIFLLVVASVALLYTQFAGSPFWGLCQMGQPQVIVMSAKLPWKLEENSAIWDGKNAYIFGGGNTNGVTDAILKYNPASDQITIMSATLPDHVTDDCAIWNGRYAFIFGGWTGQPIYSNKIARYDPTTDTVTVMSAKLPTYSMSAIWDGTNAYLFGGYDGYSCYSHILRYNPATDQLATMNAQLPTGIKWTSAVWTGTYAYIFGGYPYSDQIVKYDPITDSVTMMTAKLPQKLIFTSAVWTGTYALIFGGAQWSDASARNIMSDKIIKYEPAHDSITIMDQTLPTPRMATSAIWDGNNTYIFGGDLNNTAIDEIVKFSPTPLTHVSLVPNTGFASATAIGSGFSPNSKIIVTWDDTKMPTVPSPLITDSNGNFTAIISVPTQTEPGTHTVKATDESGNWASATFTVINMTGPKGETRKLSLLVDAFAIAVSIIAICLATIALLKKKT